MGDEYPAWKYKGGKSVVVQNKKEEKSLGFGWSDSPSESKKTVKKRVRKSIEYKVVDSKLVV